MMYKFSKRLFDFFLSLFLLMLLWPIVLILLFVAALDTRSNGLFIQKRIGQYAKPFNIYKIRSYHKDKHSVSAFGRFIRSTKLDELPQLINVLIGEMSFVGPRPDVEGYYDNLQGEDRLILNLKPGITSEASIKYKDEDKILERQIFPLEYNDKVIFPDKVKMNLRYYYNKTLLGDVLIIIKTVIVK